MPDMSTQHSISKVRWRFWLQVVVVLCVLYVLCYFPLMDKTRPTAFGAYKDFQSSFRWAPPMPWKDGSPSKFPDTTIWNVIYEPMDSLYFRIFPRSGDEWEQLRAYGYEIGKLRH